jgi:hypothetical protein
LRLLAREYRGAMVLLYASMAYVAATSIGDSLSG